MDNIIFSKKSFEDLINIKESIGRKDLIQSVVVLNQIIDDIYLLKEEDYKHKIFKDDFYYFLTNDKLVFYKLEEDIKIIRILESNEEILNIININN